MGAADGSAHLLQEMAARPALPTKSVISINLLLNVEWKYIFLEIRECCCAHLCLMPPRVNRKILSNHFFEIIKSFRAIQLFYLASHNAHISNRGTVNTYLVEVEPASKNPYSGIPNEK